MDGSNDRRVLLVNLILWLGVLALGFFVVYITLNPPVREISTGVEVNASEARVWQVLTDFEAYPEWNPFMRVTGSLTPGSQLSVNLTPPGGKAITLKPTVQVVEPNRRLVWLDQLWISDVFDSNHTFDIVPAGSRVRFFQNETFRGVLVPLRSGEVEIYRQGFVEMNAALKARAES